MHALYFISTMADGITNSKRTLKQINKILRVHGFNVAEPSQGAHSHSASEAIPCSCLIVTQQVMQFPALFS